MTPKDNPRDTKPQDDGASFDLERLLARYELRISQVQFDLPSAEPPVLPPRRPAPPPLDLPPPPRKKSYFEDIAAAPPPAAPPQASAARPQLGPIEPPKNEEPPPPASPPPASAAPAFPRTKGRRPLFLGAAAALLLLLGFLIWRTAAPKARGQHLSFPLPMGRMMGLVSRDQSLLTVDTDKQALIIISPDTGKIVSREKFPNPSLRGFAWGQGSFWSSDLESGFIYQHSAAEPHSLINAFPTNRAISVLHHDGRSLWASDVRSEIVHRYALTGRAPAETLSRQQEYPLPGIAVGGFYQDQDVLWILDSLSRKVRRYRLAEEGKLVLFSAIDLSPWLAPNSEIAGFAVDALSLWLITDNPASLHRFDLAQLPWTEEKTGP